MDKDFSKQTSSHKFFLYNQETSSSPNQNPAISQEIVKTWLGHFYYMTTWDILVEIL